MKKYRWTTHKIVRETADSLSIYFDTGEQPISFLPGQYLNLRCVIDETLVIRSYSFSSQPADAFPSITIKCVAGGKMSNYLWSHAEQIDLWEIDGPFGTFYLDQAVAQKRQVVLLAGGSGISPLYSMLKSSTAQSVVPLLIYANKSPEETIFLEALENLVAAGKLAAHYAFSAPDFSAVDSRYTAGRFSKTALSSLLDQQQAHLSDAHYYLCGPVGLIDLYVSVLRSLGVSPENIHTEFFDSTAIPKTPAVISDDGIVKDVLVHYMDDTYFNDELHTYQCTSLIEVSGGQSLLEAMQNHNIKVPSSCKNGTCGVCWAVKTDGEVHMVNNHTLTERDIAEGIVLLCQSYPMNQEVSISLG
ncbi:FAD-binding oxidoreductase [Flavobacterium sp. JP2137]|uniref:FAD-binding oxidoreductase n=1 Tax=Flavobacterium sp. JP2137 TaxID=3414510 RepID=UPI003D2FB58A